MVSLFTFMDSLVCTMGALILLMLWITHSTGKLKKFEKPKPVAASTAPVASTPPAPLPPVAELPEPIVVSASPFVGAPAFDEAIPSQIEGTADKTDPELVIEIERFKQVWQERLARAETERDQFLLQIRTERKQKAALDQIQKKAEAEILLTREQLATLEAEREELLKSKAASQTELDKLLERIANTKRNLELLKKKQADAKSEFAIVPYDGASGTKRRPVYIECTDHGYHILPEDVWIRAGDLKGFSEKLNPLLVGVTTLHDYWTHRAQTSGNQMSEEPYVLLVVRPSGTMAYYVARKLLTSFRGQNGYELVEEDWKLSMPAADPTAKAVLVRSIEQARAIRDRKKREESEMAESLVSDSEFDVAPLRRSRSVVNDSIGSIVQDRPGGPLRYRAPPDSVAEISRMSRALPTGVGEGSSGTGSEGGGSSETNSLLPGAGRGLNSSESPTGGSAPPDGELPGNLTAGSKASPAVPGSVGDNVLGGTMAGSVGPGSLGEHASAGEPGLTPGGQSAAPGSRRQRGRRGLRGSLASSGRPGTRSGSAGSGDLPDLQEVLSASQRAGQGTGRKSAGRPGTPLPAGMPEPLVASTFGGEPAGSSGTEIGSPGNSVASGSGGLHGGDSSGSELVSAQPSSGGMPDDSENGLGVSDGNSANPAGIGGAVRGSRSQFRTGLMPPDDSGSSSNSVGAEATGAESSGAEASGEGATGSSARANGSTSAGGEPSGLRPDRRALPNTIPEGVVLHPHEDLKGRASPFQGEQEETFSRMSARRSETGEPGSKSPGMVPFDFGSNDSDGKRGRRENFRKSWTALRGRSGIGLEQRVEIHLLEDRLLIGPDDATVMAGRGETRTELLQRVLYGIEAASESWGTPPQNFFYVPKVHFKIYPGGNQYHERLRLALHQHGIESTAEYALDGTPGKVGRGGGR